MTEPAIPLTLSLDTDRLFAAMHNLPYFNSFCEIDGDLYAAGPLGIHRLSGDTDNGSVVHTGVIWDRIDFGVSNQKRLRAALLTGDVGVSVVQAVDDSAMGSLFSVSRGRAAIGRNLVGRNWTIRVADFERLESIEFFPVVLGR